MTGSFYSASVAVLLLAFVSGLSTLLGVALAIYAGKNGRAIAVGIGVSVGIMLLVSHRSGPTQKQEAV